MKQYQRKVLKLTMPMLLFFASALTGCGGGGSDSPASSNNSSSSASGIALPSEVSAVSTKTNSGASLFASFFQSFASAVSDLPADSDYKKMKTARFVDEKTLKVFGIIETILKAVAQTNYADATNLGKGPYRAMVGWEEDNQGRSQKQLQEWTVDSSMTTENGQNINLVQLWIEDPEQDIRVKTKIYQAATQDANGNYLDYGVWTIEANFYQKGTNNSAGSFYAHAEIDGTGRTVLSMREISARNENINNNNVLVHQSTVGLLKKSNTAGFGKVEVTDSESCWQQNPPVACTPVNGEVTPPLTKIRYAYNASYLGLSEDDGATVTYKDRNDEVVIAYRYGLFYATNGEDVRKTKQFGFPIRYAVNNEPRHAYYGAWQGRHQIWTPSGTLADDTQVTREDVPPGQAAPTYTVKSFNGTLTKRILTASDVSQIQNIPVEIWLGENTNLIYTANGWKKCNQEDITWNNPPTCSNPQDFDLSKLQVSQNSRKNVNISRGEDPDGFAGPSPWKQYRYSFNAGNNIFTEIEGTQGTAGHTYAANGSTGAGGDWTVGDTMWVWLGGSTYIKYIADFDGNPTASGWVELPVTEFDQRTWTPTFGNPVAFDFPLNMEYYVNNKGTNFVVKRIGQANAPITANSYQTKMELQQVANPLNAGSFLPNGAYFKDQMAQNSPTKYELSTTPGSTFLLLVYKAVDANNDPGKSIGDIVTKNIWGLNLYNGAAELQPSQFNWEYANGENSWGKVTYLKSGAEWILLTDPISLQPIALTPRGGVTPIQFSLQYDGWMHGLPDMHWELEKNNYIMTPDLANKIVNIPAGTELTDSNNTNIKYLAKPLETGVILNTVTPPNGQEPNVNSAEITAINLSDVPTAANLGMPAKPQGTTLKYVEGISVE